MSDCALLCNWCLLLYIASRGHSKIWSSAPSREPGKPTVIGNRTLCIVNGVVSVWVFVGCWQPPTPEQLEMDIKIESIKKEISDLVAEVNTDDVKQFNCDTDGTVSFYSFPSVLWYCWLLLLTCKIRLPCNLYCVGVDVKPCSVQYSFYSLISPAYKHDIPICSGPILVIRSQMIVWCSRIVS